MRSAQWLLSRLGDDSCRIMMMANSDGWACSESRSILITAENVVFVANSPWNTVMFCMPNESVARSGRRSKARMPASHCFASVSSCVRAM